MGQGYNDREDEAIAGKDGAESTKRDMNLLQWKRKIMAISMVLTSTWVIEKEPTRY